MPELGMSKLNACSHTTKFSTKRCWISYHQQAPRLHHDLLRPHGNPTPFPHRRSSMNSNQAFFSLRHSLSFGGFKCTNCDHCMTHGPRDSILEVGLMTDVTMATIDSFHFVAGRGSVGSVVLTNASFFVACMYACVKWLTVDSVLNTFEPHYLNS